MPINKETRSQGTFVPAPEAECECKSWFTAAEDIQGHPIGHVRQRYTVWKRGGELQKFFAALDIHVDSASQFQAPEIDCDHSMCHMHPNGHKPPSGVQQPLVKIVDLHSVSDVRLAQVTASYIIESTILNVFINGGEWDEQTVSRSAIQSAATASYQVE